MLVEDLILDVVIMSSPLLASFPLDAEEISFNLDPLNTQCTNTVKSTNQRVFHSNEIVTASILWTFKHF